MYSLGGIGGIVGIWIPEKVGMLVEGIYEFLKKQNVAVTWIIVGVCYIVAIFLPMLIYLIAGLGASHALYFSAVKAERNPPPPSENPPEE